MPAPLKAVPTIDRGRNSNGILAIRRLQVLAVTFFVASLLFVPSAVASAYPVTLRWRAPPACPNQDAIRKSLLELLPDAARNAPASGLRIDAEVTQQPDGTFAGRLQVRVGGSGGDQGREGERREDGATRRLEGR